MYYIRRKTSSILISVIVVYVILFIYIIIYSDDFLYNQNVVSEMWLHSASDNYCFPSASSHAQQPLLFKFFYACDKEIVFFDKMFAVVSNVLFESFIRPQNQTPTSQPLTKFGLRSLSTHCAGVVDITGLHLKEPILTWVKQMRLTERFNDNEKAPVHRDIGLLLSRHDEGNLYHAMTQMYNIVIAKLLLGISPNRSVVGIFADDYGSHTILQELWDSFFQETLPLSGESHRKFHFDKLIMINSGYEGYLNHHRLSKLPFVGEFKQYFKSLFGACSQRKLDCSSINIRVILRQDGMYRNGTIKVTERKFYNERNLLKEIQKSFPSHSVKGLRLENYPMKTQLLFISKTDFLIGVHGAGMTFALFLPEHAGVLELFPLYRDTGNVHYRTISKWRNLHYRAWQNFKTENEFPNFQTHFPVRVIAYYIQEFLNSRCKRHSIS